MIHELQRQLRQALPPNLVADFDSLIRMMESPRRTGSGGESNPTLTLGGLASTEEAPTEALPPVGTEDRYTDLGLLGIGGMGEVRRVRDRALERTMAMKIIRPDLMARPRSLARFMEEAQCTAQLQHPGIVPVHELGRLPDGRYYFTMAEVRGRRLSEVIGEVHGASSGDRWEVGPSGWTFRGLIDAFHRVCETVAYAHSRGVVHRDLKPDNIMVGAHGEVLVLDWGLAKVGGRPDLAASAWAMDTVVTDRSQDAGQATRMGAVAGTPAYMPPEQAVGAVNQIDARSDVYALGAILYEILSGRAPYAGRSGRDVLAQVRAGSPPPPGRGSATADPPLPDDLVAACVRAMARSPGDRFSDAGVLAAELGAWLDGARLRDQALAVVAQAEALAPEVAALRSRADVLEAESVALLADLEPWRPEEDKLAGWAKADEAAALRREADRRDLRHEQSLAGALRIDPTLPEAHSALVERHRAAHLAAEDIRDTEVTDRAAHLLQAHAEALPDDHPARRRAAVYLKGDGALTLVTDPPGAEVMLYRDTLRHRRLVPVLERTLGRTPLSRVSLPMGSYRCVLRADGRADVTYPVHIGRGDHWHGVPPGRREAHAIWLPPEGDLGPEDCYVPAGWFTAGGDPGAHNSMSRRKVWVDGFSLSRFPVINRDYIAFLNDLMARDREQEALGYAPRERGGTQGEVGALIPGFADGRFSLRPDADGDVWLPDYPVCMVDWHGATAFAAWRAARTGQDWRLPHELEWEKTARGVDGRLYPWGDGFDPSWCHMNDSHQGRRLPAVVGAYRVDESVYGARDLTGNMRDWTATVHLLDGDVVDGGRVSVSPGAGTGGADRVVRGAGWGDGASHLRAADRLWFGPSSRFSVLGFRIVRSIKGPVDP